MALILKDGTIKGNSRQKIEELRNSIAQVQLNNGFGLLRRQAVKELYNHAHDLMVISSRLCREAGIETVAIPQSNCQTISDIIEKVNEFFGVNILIRTRVREVVVARQACALLCRMFTNASLKDIGNQMGGLDHTCVIHAKDKCRDNMSVDASYAAQVNTLISFFTGNINDQQAA